MNHTGETLPQAAAGRDAKAAHRTPRDPHLDICTARGGIERRTVVPSRLSGGHVGIRPAGGREVKAGMRRCDRSAPAIRHRERVAALPRRRRGLCTPVSIAQGHAAHPDVARDCDKIFITNVINYSS